MKKASYGKLAALLSVTMLTCLASYILVCWVALNWKSSWGWWEYHQSFLTWWWRQMCETKLVIQTWGDFTELLFILWPLTRWWRAHQPQRVFTCRFLWLHRCSLPSRCHVSPDLWQNLTPFLTVYLSPCTWRGWAWIKVNKWKEYILHGIYEVK